MLFFAFVSSAGVFFTTVFFVFTSSAGVSLSEVVRGDFRVGIAAKLKFTFDVERTDGTNGCVGAAAAGAFVTGFGDWRVDAFAFGLVSFDLLCCQKQIVLQKGQLRPEHSVGRLTLRMEGGVRYCLAESTVKRQFCKASRF